MKPFDHFDDQWFLYSNKGKRWALFFDEYGELRKEKLSDLAAPIEKLNRTGK
jgi:hypothetical protein